MASIQNSAKYLQQQKNNNKLTEIQPPQRIEQTLTPAPQVYPNPMLNLRTPMPFVTQQSPDVQRQFLNPSIPQRRVFPLSAGSNTGANASTESQISASSTPVIPIPPIPPTPTGQFYEVNGNGIFGQIVQINGASI